MEYRLRRRQPLRRLAYAFSGPGKCELLTRFVEAIRPQQGRCILNEADVYAEIDLPPRDPVLLGNLIDSYVRRAGMALATELDRTDLYPAARQTLETTPYPLSTPISIPSPAHQTSCPWSFQNRSPHPTQPSSPAGAASRSRARSPST
mgnify:CR=1 FL=1